jgi:cyclic beta-1,2-glucan synthetase
LIEKLLHRPKASTATSSQALERPIRAELFGVERLEQHAESLAVAQRITAKPSAGRPLAPRLRDNDRVLRAAYRVIAKATLDETPITPAAEWLVDNFHIVEDQVREIKDDLPAGFYSKLPKLADGPLAGYPRVFGVAWAFVAHTDSRFDPALLCRFVQAYQRVEPLTIGELWAIAITLRIVLVENLRRLAEQIVAGRADRRRADILADRLLGTTGQEPEPTFLVLGELSQENLSAAFAVQFVQRLRDQDFKATPALLWLDDHLKEQGTTAEEIVREEHQRLGASNVTVRNVITSMRLISSVDWTELFESMSLVDSLLRAGSDFGQMDFPTRDLYRRAIEEISRHAPHSETDIARLALDAAMAGDGGAGRDPASAARLRDPGHYLIGRGRRSFERECGFRIPMRGWLERINAVLGISGYLGIIAIIGAVILALAILWGAEPGGRWTIAVLSLLALIPASDVAMALVNRGALNRFGARILSALELKDGVPSSLRTIVVVPTLLTTQAAIEEQIERLEVHHLSSPDGDLRFALLSDFTDADEETMESDGALLIAAIDGIARLNQRHGPAEDGERFLLFHRRRVWNPSQGRWMGWERKRGKLHELNRLLRGAADTTFVSVGGRPPAVPAGVRYVITLDADTRLPRGAAKRLVGKMAHPLNRPSLDAATRRVTEGYAVLQPRVTPSLPVGREGSLFQRVFSSPGGIDPYASAASDLYQDLFGEGSYSGKGIYDLDMFEAALEGRIPENSVLSHDLLEGIFARAGLASDIEVVEDFPSRYDVAAARQHRWARGDWQLLPWILGFEKKARDSDARTSIPLIGRWKMIDNLRRSLSAPTTFLTLLGAWTLPFAASGSWTAFILLTMAVPPLLPVAAGILPRRLSISKRTHLRAVATDLGHALWHIFLLATFLAYQAWSMTDAILRTLFRVCVSHRRLLEWVTAAQAKVSPRPDLAGFYRQMAGSVVLAVVAAALVGWFGRGAWPFALPFVAMWGLSPAIARWASLSPTIAVHQPISALDSQYLRLTARRTWRFFETFVTAENHMLPPDNFQEVPKPVIAHRTSPTNLGLYLLSVIAARDFGWLGLVDCVERLELTLGTMSELERFRGHFFNWYDTHDLRPLEPKYISSVDSGNLAGHLITLANACREKIGHRTTGPEWIGGIQDALSLTRESLGVCPDEAALPAPAKRQLDAALGAMAVSLAEASLSAADIAGHLPTFVADAERILEAAQGLVGGRSDDASTEVAAWAEAVLASVLSHQRDIAEAAADGGPLDRRLAALADVAEAMCMSMQFGFLVNAERQLLSIGYRIDDGVLDPSCYDLLASEARLASLVAIAKGDVPAKHWFRLGRAMTPVDRGSALISWSGSMFEYLMPSLVMRAPAGSLLEQTARLIVRRQIKYGTALGVPWGVSESAYNVRDLELTYQYSNFGIPGLGLKRGLSENIVIAPYATALAAMVDPEAAARNFARLAGADGRGKYGLYEALDYTPARLPEGEDVVIIFAYMAHHQAMTVIAIANALHDGAMRTRFHADPIIQATELLLQERPPRDVAVARPRADEVSAAANVRELVPPMLRSFQSPNDPVPRTHLLSNGNYTVMITSAGSGYSRWRDLAVTRWREDTTRDNYGSYIFLRDTRSGDAWSAGYQPSGAEPDRYTATFSEGRAEFIRHDKGIMTTLEVAVSPEDDAEVRRVSIANPGSRARDVDVTSYIEIVLAPHAADVAHPAFSKLFVQTEFVEEAGALLATRRRRAPDEPEAWAAHLAVVEGESSGALQFETDRARFIGRGRGIRTPIAILGNQPLSNTAGTVLDPIFSLRRRLRIPPRSTARIAFWTLIASTRQGALDLADKHRDAAAFERTTTLSWTQAQVQLRHLGITTDEAHLFQRIANRVLYSDPTLRPSSEILKRNESGPSKLWAHGISGDLPIVLLRIDSAEDLSSVHQLLRAQEYWRLKQLAVDLVILNERPPSYDQELQLAIEAMLRMNQSRAIAGGAVVRGAAFYLRGDLLPAETRDTLQAVARAVFRGRRGSLAEQVRRLREPVYAPAPSTRPSLARGDTAPALPRQALEFFNGLGGFALDGREYVTILNQGQSTPAPWVNVIANPSFGFQVSVEGGGYIWSLNSRENQLTPWSNDPVSDPPGEVIYVRDDESGEIWTPTASPIREDVSPYVVRHGQGYSRFEYVSHGIALDLVQYVPLDDSIKIARLKIRNVSTRIRRLSITAYIEWVLGPSRAAAPFVVTEIDSETGAMLARNPWRNDFGRRVAFVDLSGRQNSWTGDRTEFLGRNGGLGRPAALALKAPLSNRVGAGLDPCGALQTPVLLAAGGETEVVVFVGEAAAAPDALALVKRYRTTDLDAVLASVKRYWDDLLGTVQVKTPDRSMDIQLNGWLLYQTLSCRIWARSAFYQAGGAYGFRDQLQDGMALAVSKPAIAREHLLRASARQFVEGDVQHWWLPHSGQGVRTRISDDRVWLPYVVVQYVDATGDRGVLDEIVPFLEGPALQDGEHESFFQPMIAEERATLFEHCALALDRSLLTGSHGLPLMGGGDWNDGMNRIGIDGKGESVWLAWFLFATLSAFATLAEARGEENRVKRWRAHAASLRTSVEREAWDGAWYRRAYFGDGTPVGSATQDECRIDSIAQSWGVISGAANPDRAGRAMAEVEKQLVRREDGLVLLFTPPFERTLSDPGYIKGYPPGIRENGGQYTHGAIWTAIAFAMLGDGDKAAELFSILNPINRTSTAAGIGRYKVEPYVICADEYSAPSHVGQGGWTWYTGSAAWMYRAGLEWILGFRLKGAELFFDPCIPRAWPRFEILFRYRSARYEIAVENPKGVSRGISHVELDGKAQPSGLLPILLVDDSATHRLLITLGQPLAES